MGSCVKDLKEINVDVYTVVNRHQAHQLLVDDNFEISFKIPGFGQTIKNIKSKNFKLAAHFKTNDQIQVNGLVGVDFIQKLKLKMVPCLNE